MAKTRTMVEINNDYKLCKKYVDEHPNITSLTEIANAFGLSVSQVKTSLSRHPRIFDHIMNLIADNSEAAKAHKHATKKETCKSEQTTIKTTNTPEVEKIKIFRYVIDASIMGTDNIINTLTDFFATGNKIVLTSITIKELEKLQKHHNTFGNDARRILAMAAGDYENFECVLIDEPSEVSADDCIIRYCAENKDDVVLLTSDKTMELKARTYGVKTRFFKQNNIPGITGHAYNVRTTYTLYATRKIGNNLYTSVFENAYKSIRVISGNIEYNTGTVKLKIGDDVYIATKKNNYITFAHYRMISLSIENNCQLVCYRRLYDSAEINNLPNASYKSFMRAFKCRVNF